MQLSDHITPNTIKCKESASSKKRALEILSHFLAITQPDLQETEIFDKLLERERLGSTGLGEGVAIPHCRMAKVRQAMIALLTLEEGVDFDARDSKPVDLLFALIVPEDCTETHLKLLALAAEMFSDGDFCSHLRESDQSQAAYELLLNWKSKSLSA